MKGKILVALWLAFSSVVSAAEEAQPMFVVHFTKGAGWDDSLAPMEQAAFREHSANLGKLRREGVIVFGARYEDAGMVFLRAESLQAAHDIIAADPGVQAGTFAFTIASLRVFYDWHTEAVER